MTEHRSLSWAEKEARRDYIKVSERGGEIVGIVAIVLIALFFYAHQAWSTGFFTSAFGPIEAFFLYGSILIRYCRATSQISDWEKEYFPSS